MPKAKPKVIITGKTASVSYGRTISSGVKYEFERFDATTGVQFSHDIQSMESLDVDTRKTLDDLMQDIFEFIEDEVRRVRKG